VQTLFDIAVGQWGWRPEQFWRCRPGDFWWAFKAKLPPEKINKPAQLRELYDLLTAAEAEGQKTHG